MYLCQTRKTAKNKGEHPTTGTDSLYIFRPKFSISFSWKHEKTN
uniref:Uncharacterized protein n=1 Tax=Siphoviridae sp. ctAUQ2 TaxID=2826182 RepID=A0A8S5MYU5_9CAUD|nr:MAG TPA: hypothetical protein [Siphoviridae sp. ctAUQ2]